MTTRHGAHHRRVRIIVLTRDNWVCHWCAALATELDHYPVPESAGGPTTPGNGVASCRACNASRGAQLVNDRRVLRRRHPFFLAGDHDPTAVPVLSPPDQPKGLSSQLRRRDDA